MDNLDMYEAVKYEQIVRKLKQEENGEQKLINLPRKTVSEVLEEENKKEIEEIYYYQEKVQKILKLQEEHKDKVIVELKIDNLFGMSEEDLDCLIEYYEE